MSAKPTKIKQQMDKSSKYYKSINISMSSSKSKPEDRRVPPTVTCSGRMNFGKEGYGPDDDDAPKMKSYAEMAKSNNYGKEKLETMIQDDDESELSSDK